MSRRPARYTQADLARAIRAFEQVHGVQATVEIGVDGAVRVIPVPLKDDRSGNRKVEPKRGIVLG